MENSELSKTEELVIPYKTTEILIHGFIC
jgi:hypothetical protein